MSMVCVNLLAELTKAFTGNYKFIRCEDMIQNPSGAISDVLKYLRDYGVQVFALFPSGYRRRGRDVLSNAILLLISSYGLRMAFRKRGVEKDGLEILNIAKDKNSV